MAYANDNAGMVRAKQCPGHKQHADDGDADYEAEESSV
jgi:hypothetical protein